MSNIPRLKTMLIKAKEVCKEAELRFATIDWEAEFNAMDDDEEYSPVPFLTDVDFYESLECNETKGEDGRDAKTFMKAMKLWSCCLDVSRDVVDLVGAMEQLKYKIVNMYKTKLREEFLKEDIDLRPPIYCSKCDIFAMSVLKFSEHECKQTTKCNHCDFKATTYERLENHIQAKHLKKHRHNCKECEYSTDSLKEFERHNNSKGHKQKCGIKKEIVLFDCKICDRQYAFESQYLVHCASVKHKKLSNS